MFPFVPAREPSSISSWRESQASRKLSFAELWPTLLLSLHVPILATCWARCLPWLLSPLQQNQVNQRDHFPHHVRQWGEGYIWGRPRTNLSRSVKHKWLIASLNPRRPPLMMTLHPRWGHCSSLSHLCQTSPCLLWAWASSCCWCLSSCSAETARRR